MSHSKEESEKSFLLSFTATLFILVAIMVITVLSVQPSMPKNIKKQSTTQVEYMLMRPLPEDSLTAVVIGKDNSDIPSHFLLIRFNPQYGQIPLSMLPVDSLVLLNNEPMTLSEAYQTGGPNAVKQAISEYFKIKVDRYAVLERDTFIRIAKQTGTVLFTLPDPISYEKDGYQINLPDGLHRLDGQDVANLFSAPFSRKDELSHLTLLGNLTTEIINQNIDAAGSKRSSVLFKLAVNLLDTDISSPDYELRRDAADFISQLDAQISGNIPVQATFSESKQVFEYSEQYIEQIRKYFNPTV